MPRPSLHAQSVRRATPSSPRLPRHGAPTSTWRSARARPRRHPWRWTSVGAVGTVVCGRAGPCTHRAIAGALLSLQRSANQRERIAAPYQPPRCERRPECRQSSAAPRLHRKRAACDLQSRGGPRAVCWLVNAARRVQAAGQNSSAASAAGPAACPRGRRGGEGRGEGWGVGAECGGDGSRSDCLTAPRSR
eukprot:scaffold109014_cov30-Tisochrysis_lutea.AAC.1